MVPVPSDAVSAATTRELAVKLAMPDRSRQRRRTIDFLGMVVEAWTARATRSGRRSRSAPFVWRTHVRTETRESSFEGWAHKVIVLRARPNVYAARPECA